MEFWVKSMLLKQLELIKQILMVWTLEILVDGLLFSYRMIN